MYSAVLIAKNAVLWTKVQQLCTVLDTALAIYVNICTLYSEPDLCDLVDCLLEVGLELPGGLLRLGHAVGEALLHAVRLLPQVLAAGAGHESCHDMS